MKISAVTSNTVSLTALIVAAVLPTPSHGHGLVSDPPSRNWYCGAITKPDEVDRGVAQYPECGAAFANDFNGGYQFMSVLTHDVGRKGVTPLPTNVCGFDSETWQGGPTPWDSVGVDWPTTTIDSGKTDQLIQWNIAWGPHFDDTEEFVHYITKADFVYDPNTALTWNDFEAVPFCDLGYDHSNPTGNPKVVANVGSTIFNTYCDMPARTGRHIIYAEWGRNHFTYERFHGCIDVEFVGGDPAPVAPDTPAPIAPDTPAPIAPDTPAPVTPDTPAPVGPTAGIPYPCCGWNGDCEQPENTWCHATCDQCTGPCNGDYFSAPGVLADCSGGDGDGDGGDDGDDGDDGCCTWGGWSTCPSWTQTSNDPCQQDAAGCSGCSGTWISSRRRAEVVVVSDAKHEEGKTEMKSKTLRGEAKAKQAAKITH